ncbi:MAG: hypothetical protein H6709_07145 [Kofleriaceae bacterium]|nr:hypothetical protein [Myxococcales bacterium]MCB9560093.1 hypothetical protein [Kofleriaceae bacterium]MCB9571854.1 hypothetical protein [Kofleriaceae bacterium]
MKKHGKLALRKHTVRALVAVEQVRGGSPLSVFVCPPTERESCNVCDLTIGKCSVICI